jgi:hypothetical protein
MNGNDASSIQMSPSTNFDDEEDDSKLPAISNKVDDALHQLCHVYQLDQAPEVLASAAIRAYRRYDLQAAFNYCQELIHIDPLLLRLPLSTPLHSWRSITNVSCSCWRMSGLRPVHSRPKVGLPSDATITVANVIMSHSNVFYRQVPHVSTHSALTPGLPSGALPLQLVTNLIKPLRLFELPNGWHLLNRLRCSTWAWNMSALNTFGTGTTCVACSSAWWRSLVLA